MSITREWMIAFEEAWKAFKALCPEAAEAAMKLYSEKKLDLLALQGAGITKAMELILTMRMK